MYIFGNFSSSLFICSRFGWWMAEILKGKGDEVSFFNDKAVAGSLTMTSVRIG